MINVCYYLSLLFYQFKINSFISNPKISWTRLTEPKWDKSTGVEFPCALYYGKHFLVMNDNNVSSRMF